MLVQLKVENYALIDEMVLEFSAGFNVLTGETGAGKSIIVDTVMLLLGARAKVEDIRKGRTHALIEGVFDIENADTTKLYLEELGLVFEDTLVLTREIQSSGKNRCRINHRIVTLTDFKKIAESLINIYGQHDYQTITKREGQLELLDSLGDNAFVLTKEAVKKSYIHLQKTARALKKALNAKKTETEKRSQLERELGELLPYQLKKGEEDEINLKFNRLSHTQALKEVSGEAVYHLYGAEESCYSKLYQTIQSLSVLAKRDESLKEYLSPLKEAIILIEDTAKELSFYKEGLDLDSETYNTYEARIALYDRLRRRYKMSVDDLVDEMKVWESELLTLNESDSLIDELKQTYLEAKKTYDTMAKNLHEKRVLLAKSFSEKLLYELKDLSMDKARFEVAFNEIKPKEDGIDEVLFLIAPNPGGDLRPLEEVASGGEMSRIMLAFKTLLTEKGQIETLIFDEVDTGIGGLILTQVAEKLSKVAKTQQVLCVTHAPVIASLSDCHFYIEKKVVDKETMTSVTPLVDEKMIIDELSRMLGGKENWQVEHARALREKKIKKHT